MFDILKDSNGRFNKKNTLPLASTFAVGTMTVLSAVAAIPRFFSHPSLSSPLGWKDPSYSEFLAIHIPATIVTFSILGLCTYLAIDKIRQNKQTENLRANSEPNTCVYTASINDVLEEQNQL
ncbi:MAG: hypothetical protein AB3P07_04955 [Wolbachia pipientis]